MEGNMPVNVNGMGMVSYGMGAMPTMGPTSGFLDQMQEGRKEATSFDMDLANKNLNRNRGNYRCSKCGEPKKGHVCPLVPSNFKCNRCGLSKKSCTCVGGNGPGHDHTSIGSQRARYRRIPQSHRELQYSLEQFVKRDFDSHYLLDPVATRSSV